MNEFYYHDKDAVQKALNDILENDPLGLLGIELDRDTQFKRCCDFLKGELDSHCCELSEKWEHDFRESADRIWFGLSKDQIIEAIEKESGYDSIVDIPDRLLFKTCKILLWS